MAATPLTIALIGVLLATGGCMTMQPRDIRQAPEKRELEDEFDMGSAMAYLARGLLSIELEEDLEESAVFLEKAARLYPRDLELVILAAQTLYDADQPGRATDLIELASAYHGESAEAQYRLARLLWHGGANDAAGDFFETAMKLDPGDAQSRIGLGFLKLQTNAVDEARVHFEDARRLAPGNPLPYIGLAISALESKNPDAALDIVNKAIDRDIDDPALTQFFKEFALLSISQKRFEEALPCLKALQALNPDDINVHQLTALTYARLDRHEEAAAALRHWPEAPERPGMVADLMADIYESIKSYPRAIDYALKSVTKPDAPRQAWLRAGRLLLMSARAEEALGLMTNATELYPENAIAWLFRGLAYSATGNYKGAVAALEEAAEASKRDEPEGFTLPSMFDFWIGAAYERAGRLEDAEHHFRRSTEKHPEIHEAFNYLAYMWAEQDAHLDEARELVSVALEAEPDNSAYIDTLGWIYYKQGLFEKALEEIMRALESQQDHPVINDHAGDVLHALQLTDKALEYWKRSFMHDPDNEEVREKLERFGIDLKSLLDKHDPP